MGTYGGYPSRKALVDEVTAGFENDTRKVTLLAKYFSGNHLWCVFEVESKPQFPGSPVEKSRWIELFLISRWGEGNWAYKPMEESTGPYYYSCPLSFLDMVPEPPRPKDYQDWRAKVREFHARKAQTLVVGQVVRLINGQDYTIVEVGRRIRGRDKYGITYRIPRSMLTLSAEQKDFNDQIKTLQEAK